MCFFLKLIAVLNLIAAPCFASISVTASPIGSSAPVDVIASVSSSSAITGWCIYVDSVLVFRQNTSATKISEWVTMTVGTHQVVVRAWDSTGAFGSAYLTVSIGSAGGGGITGSGLIPTPPSSAKFFNNVDEMIGWIGCTVCANGPVAQYWMKQFVSSPSLDGNGIETWIGEMISLPDAPRQLGRQSPGR